MANPVANESKPRREFLAETLTAQTDVRVMRSERGDSIVRQNCPDGQFWLISRGIWSFRSEGPSQTFGVLDFVYSAPGEPCIRTAEQTVVALGIQIRGSLLREWPESRRWLQSTGEVDWQDKRSYLRLMRGYLSGSLSGDDLEDAAVSLIARSSRDSGIVGRPAWLNQAREILHDGGLATESLSSLASAVGISPCHLSLTYRSVYGVTLASARRRIRLSRAFRISSDLQISLNEAAIEAGFYDASHFHRACVTELGMPPQDVHAVLKTATIENLYKTSD